MGEFQRSRLSFFIFNEIDKANLASVTKFAYLKELVDPKVLAEIDGLPFTTEGYERARISSSANMGKRARS